jgi:hypothetical protein
MRAAKGERLRSQCTTARTFIVVALPVAARAGMRLGVKGPRVQILPARLYLALLEATWALVVGCGIGWSITEISHRPCESHTERSSSALGSPLGGRRQAADRLALGPGYPETGLVLVDTIGQPIRPETYSDRFRASREAGLPRAVLHSVRHTLALIMRRAGVPPVDAAALLGHSLEVHYSTYLACDDHESPPSVGCPWGCGGGKSWFAAWQAAAVLNAGGCVAYAHFEEATPRITVARLIQPGVPLDVIKTQFFWIPTDRPPKPGEGLRSSMGYFLTSCGLRDVDDDDDIDDDDDDDTETVYDRLWPQAAERARLAGRDSVHP